jgi:hypothetical protein
LHQLFAHGIAWYKIWTATGKSLSNLLKQKMWLPGMGSNHECASESVHGKKAGKPQASHCRWG